MARPPPLPVVPRPQPDEYLAAWLWRLASVYGLSAPVLLHRLWPELAPQSPFGSLSHDLPPESLEILADCVRLPVEALAGFTLPRLRPQWGKTFLTPGTETPAYAYCPACLLEDENAGRPHHFRADWACAVAFRCPIHDIDLHLGCPECGHTSFIFYGDPQSTRLFCAHCRANLARKSGRTPNSRFPGFWPLTDPGEEPIRSLEEHGHRIIAFTNAAVTALAGKPVDTAWIGSSCPETFQAMLVGLLRVLSLPSRSGVGVSHPRPLAQMIRFPWNRLARRSDVSPRPVDLISSFANLPVTVRFDIMVGLYAIITGAEGLITLRTWDLSRQDWRIYHLADPAAQLLCAAAPSAVGGILDKAKLWGPTLLAQFSAANAMLLKAEDDMRETAARLGQGDTPRPITEQPPMRQDLFLRWLGKRGDYDTLTIEDLLRFSDILPTSPCPTSFDELFAAARSAQTSPRGRNIASRDTVRSDPPADAVEHKLGNQTDIYLAAARAALASEAGARYRRASTKERNRAWSRVVRDAKAQLTKMRAQERRR